MTSREAIDVLKVLKDVLEFKDFAEAEALQIAIDALIHKDAETVMPDPDTGYVGVDDDYPVSVKQVLNITAELGALETQNRVRELPRYQVTADPDTISRKQAIDAIQKTSGMLMYQIDGFNRLDAEDIIKNLPPSPSRPHGHWIRVSVANGLDRYRCDKCGHYVTSGEDKNFCPNCGADMRQQEGGAV